MNYNTRTRAEAKPPLNATIEMARPPNRAFRGGRARRPRETGPLFERFEPFLRSGFLSARRNFELRSWSRDRGCLNQLIDCSGHRRSRDQLLYSSAPGALQSYCRRVLLHRRLPPSPHSRRACVPHHIAQTHMPLILTYADRAGAPRSAELLLLLGIQQILHSRI